MNAAAGADQRIPALLLCLAALVAGCTDATSGDDATTPSTATTTTTAPDADSTSTTALAGDSPAPVVVVGRSNHRADGNRLLEGPAAITRSPPTVIDLPAPARWVVGVDGVDDTAWVTVASDGTVTAVAPDGVTRPSGSVDLGLDAPVVVLDQGDIAVVGSSSRSESTLPGAITVENEAGVRAWIGEPTNRYAHAVLGDDLEGGALVIEHGGARVTVTLTETVIEGTAPLLADLDGDGTDEVIVTESNADEGASLVAYRLDGSVLARSTAIGTGNRWRHQIAVAPTGIDGEMELIDVQTPHIGGIVQFHRLDEERLVTAIGVSPYRSHVLGSPNLDLALVVDADGDNTLEVVVPTQGLGSIAVLERIDGAVRLDAEIGLPAGLTSNIAARTTGSLVELAAATADGSLLIWRG